jgi:CubicO group peptidase (beta-lactamase class C family)
MTVCPAAFPLRAEEFDFTPVRRLMQEGVDENVFPGASIAVIYRGNTIFHEAFGTIGCGPSPKPAYTSTVYDIASLTKAVATTATIMQLVERDSLDLDHPAAGYIPQFGRNGKNSITIRQLLNHTSGLRPHAWYIKTCSTPQELIAAICNDTLLTKPGTTTAYSDNGFIILGTIVEQITGRSLEENFRTRFSEPLGMQSTSFNPAGEMLRRIAPTGRDSTWNTKIGPRPLVNDQNAAILGGAAGHAGLFSSTGDLIRFTLMLMNDGRQDGVRYFRESSIRQFTRRNGNDERALGWDLRSLEGYASTGSCFSKASWGHLGFTGTSLWIDPRKDLAVIMLSNRVCPSSENRKIRKFRPRLHTTVAECLGFSCRKE